MADQRPAPHTAYVNLHGWWVPPPSAPDPCAQWWLAGGIDSADCYCAYQPYRADSYAASKSNINDPGTNDATEGVAPTWNAATGWTFNGSTQYLVAVAPGLSPAEVDSFVVRWANCASGNCVFGTRGGPLWAQYIYIMVYDATGKTDYRYGGGPFIGNPALVDAVEGFAGQRVMINAVHYGNIGSEQLTEKPNPVYIGGLNSNSSMIWPCAADVFAYAHYKRKLTDDEMTAVQTCLMAL